MAHSGTDNGRSFGSKFVSTPRGVVTKAADTSPDQRLLRGAVSEFVLGAPKGVVVALGGIDSESLRVLLDQVEPEQYGRRALFLRIKLAQTTEAIVEQVIDLLAETARRLWPSWFTDVSFVGCRNDTLGRLAGGAIARNAAEEITGLSPSWAEAAARLALADRPPRVIGTLPAIELAQLALAISRSGLVLVADVGATARMGPNPAAVVHALEWISQHSHGAVVALFPDLPPNEPPFDRILYGARRVMAEVGAAPGVIEPDATGHADASAWIAPWRGLPHPLSEIEQQLAKALGADTELAPLFGFNQFVDTVRGSRPKVDLVWMEGRLVVELDGYGSHGNRAAFMYDRHRDYELTLSGYTVLRLANDEIAQDIEKAIEKIRDLVKLCRTRAALEG
jgi:very-short-patch-repair endonuclease